METATEVKIIKGNPCDVWAQVEAAQHEPFIYIISLGSKWYGDEIRDEEIGELVEVLGKWKLDYRMFKNSFSTVNPCHWAYGDPAKGEPHFVDGKRMFEADGVTTFFGNFEELSHVFNIYTNHKPTIDLLTAAIEKNRKLFT